MYQIDHEFFLHFVKEEIEDCLDEDFNDDVEELLNDAKGG